MFLYLHLLLHASLLGELLGSISSFLLSWTTERQIGCCLYAFADFPLFPCINNSWLCQSFWIRCSREMTQRWKEWGSLWPVPATNTPFLFAARWACDIRIHPWHTQASQEKLSERTEPCLRHQIQHGHAWLQVPSYNHRDVKHVWTEGLSDERAISGWPGWQVFVANWFLSLPTAHMLHMLSPSKSSEHAITFLDSFLYLNNKVNNRKNIYPLARDALNTRATTYQQKIAESKPKPDNLE